MQTTPAPQAATQTAPSAAKSSGSAKPSWTPYAVAKQPDPVLSDRLRARAELVQSAQNCDSY
jgi:hypothetical protein